MGFHSGNSLGKVVILHGGASAGPADWKKIDLALQALEGFASACLVRLDEHRPLEAVVTALELMEADPQFNAGLGGALQSDGVVRVTSGLMDGTTQSFSGVINAEGIKHPSAVAHWLQRNKWRVVGQPGVQTLAGNLNMPFEDLKTEATINALEQHSSSASIDTVGCVARSANGELSAGTSTGGRTFGFPGRVSDSATVAGNYASEFAAISTTGIGEQIVDDALAARIEARCRDGMSLVEACRRCYDEATQRGHSYGWIALHRDGSWVVAHTTPSMSYIVRDESGVLAKVTPPT